MDSTALVWIRDDFRIQNNDALTYASNKHDIVTAVFIFNSSIFDNKREAQGHKSAKPCSGLQRRDEEVFLPLLRVHQVSRHWHLWLRRCWQDQEKWRNPCS